MLTNNYADAGIVVLTIQSFPQHQENHDTFDIEFIQENARLIVDFHCTLNT